MQGAAGIAMLPLAIFRAAVVPDRISATTSAAILAARRAWARQTTHLRPLFARAWAAQINENSFFCILLTFFHSCLTCCRVAVRLKSATAASKHLCLNSQSLFHRSCLVWLIAALTTRFSVSVRFIVGLVIVPPYPAVVSRCRTRLTRSSRKHNNRPSQ